MSLASRTPGGPRRNIFDVPARAGPAVSSSGTAAVPPASIFDAVTPAARHGVARLPWRRVVRRLAVAAVVGGTLAAVVAVAPSDKPARGRAVDVRPPAVAAPHVSAPKPATKAPRHAPTPTGRPRRRERHGRSARPRRSPRHAQAPRRRPAGPPARPAPAPVPEPARPAPAQPPAPSSPPAPTNSAPTPTPSPPPPAGGGAPRRPAPAPVPAGAPPQFM
jgi:hypothetical protein